MLRICDSLPTSVVRSRRVHRSYVEIDIETFIECGERFAQVSYDGRKPASVMQALRIYIRNHPEKCKGISVATRNGNVFLCRYE